MAKLISCICGREISNEASCCPGCATTQVPVSQKRLGRAVMIIGATAFTYYLFEGFKSGNIQTIISFFSQ